MKKDIIIAISGQSGCGNTTVTRMLSEKLGLDMINYTFHTMADEMGMDFEEFCKMAEKDSKYDIELDKKQVELASKGGCVLGSRLAIWMMKDADLKIYLKADVKERARRIFTREGGSVEEQIAKTEARDLRDTNRYKNLYNIDNTDYSFADLVIDSTNLDQYAVLDLILDKISSI